MSEWNLRVVSLEVSRDGIVLVSRASEDVGEAGA